MAKLKFFERYRITVDMLNPCKDLDQGSAAKEVTAPTEERAIWLVAHHYFTEFPKLEFITIKYVLHYRKDVAGWNGLSDRFYYSGKRIEREEIFNHQASKAPLRGHCRCGFQVSPNVLTGDVEIEHYLYDCPLVPVAQRSAARRVAGIPLLCPRCGYLPQSCYCMKGK